MKKYLLFEINESGYIDMVGNEDGYSSMDQARASAKQILSSFDSDFQRELFIFEKKESYFMRPQMHTQKFSDED